MFTASPDVTGFNSLRELEVFLLKSRALAKLFPESRFNSLRELEVFLLDFKPSISRATTNAGCFNSLRELEVFLQDLGTRKDLQ